MLPFIGGEVVVLNSGGPKMTVGFSASDGMVRCFWFNVAQEFKDASFSPNALHLYDEKDK